MMRGVFTLLLLHALAWLGPFAHGSQIIKGTKVPNGMMPYMVSVQNSKGKHVCGGFLVSEEFVITAAHCEKESTHVVLGTHNLKKADNNTRRQIVMKCKYSFEEVILGNHASQIPRNKNVNLIQLPDNQKLKDSQKCHVAGWGSIKSRGKGVDELEMVDVSIINRKVCNIEWKKFNKELPENIICAGGYKTSKGFCQGDSGGPLVCGGKAVGVVSFNYNKNCDYPNLPNVYTDISKYVGWIKKTLKLKRCVSVTQ